MLVLPNKQKFITIPVIFQHCSLKYCIPFVRDRSSFYETYGLGTCIYIKAFNWVNRKQLDILNTTSTDGGQTCPTPYTFLYILQAISSIVIKFSVSKFLSILVKKIKNPKILLFLNSTDHTQMGVLQMGVNTTFSFLYWKMFIVSIGLFVS